MQRPYISCIMPTANRPNFAAMAVGHFLNQNFRDCELIIVDDGRTPVKSALPNHRRVKYFYTKPLGNIGLKRNFACGKALGETILHWDDDDYYAHDWISKSYQSLNLSGADISGLNHIYFFSPLLNKFWKYENKDAIRPWLSGATMIYRRAFWQQHPFKNLQIGEDYDYIWNTGAKLSAHTYTDGFVAILHNSNTTIKPWEDPRHKKDHASNWMDVEFEGETENPGNSRYYEK